MNEENKQTQMLVLGVLACLMVIMSAIMIGCHECQETDSCGHQGRDATVKFPRTGWFVLAIPTRERKVING